MRIVMIGSGYVGLVSGACLSEFGHDVVCIDNDTDKIAGLKQGVMPIYEPGLEEVVAANVKAGRLSFEIDLKKVVPGAEAVFIAVGTPSRRGDGHADLSYVFAASEEIAKHLSGYTVIVNKSTVPVGTNRKVEDIIRKARPDADFDEDFYFVTRNGPESMREAVLDAVCQRIPLRFGLDARTDVMTLVPMRKGPVGLEALNVLVDEHLCERAADLGDYFRSELEKIGHPAINDPVYKIVADSPANHQSHTHRQRAA